MTANGNAKILVPLPHCCKNFVPKFCKGGSHAARPQRVEAVSDCTTDSDRVTRDVDRRIVVEWPEVAHGNPGQTHLDPVPRKANSTTVPCGDSRCFFIGSTTHHVCEGENLVDPIKANLVRCQESRFQKNASEAAAASSTRRFTVARCGKFHKPTTSPAGSTRHKSAV